MATKKSKKWFNATSFLSKIKLVLFGALIHYHQNDDIWMDGWYYAILHILIIELK
jgi:hypothetical protein